MKKYIALWLALALVALVVLVLSFFLILKLSSPDRDQDQQRDTIINDTTTTFTNVTNNTQLRNLTAPLDLPRYWIMFDRYPWPCDPERDGPEVCPHDEYHITWWGGPRGLQDYYTLLRTQSDDVVFLYEDETVLVKDLRESHPDIRRDLERLLRQGVLGIQTFFMQDLQSKQMRFDPTEENVDILQETYEAVKVFAESNGISDPVMWVFLDIYDSIGTAEVRKISADHYAQEVVKHVQAIREILPHVRVVIHELNPRPDFPEERIISQLQALTRASVKANVPIEGVIFDGYSADPRRIDDPCRVEEVANLPEAYRPENYDELGGITQVIAAAQASNLKAGLFVIPFDTRQAADPCRFPKREADVYDSYIAAARTLQDLSPQPDFYVVASWVGLPHETETVRRSLRDFRAIVED